MKNNTEIKCPKCGDTKHQDDPRSKGWANMGVRCKKCDYSYTPAYRKQAQKDVIRAIKQRSKYL